MNDGPGTSPPNSSLPFEPKDRQDRIFLDKEDRAYIEQHVGSGWFGRAEFLIDGYRVTLQRELITKNRLGLMTYVGGRFKGAWLLEKSKEAQSFFHLQRRALYTGKRAQKMKKIVGKKAWENTYAKERIESYTPIWPSVRAALKAFEDRNFSVQLLRPGHPILEAEAKAT